MYQGTLGDTRVCIKRVRAYLKDGPEKAIKARYRYRRFPRPPSLTKSADLLQRGRDVETFGPPKYCTTAGRHYRSVPAHFEVGA